MFTSDSQVRRVHREGIVLLGGGRALLMQVAHPAVARGVAERSDYRSDRLGRLVRTLRPMLAIACGTDEEAYAAADAVSRVHERVTGSGYRAADPELMRWVLATLIDTGLLVYRRFVGPMSVGEAGRYYEEMCEVGQLLGLPRSAMPADPGAFERYVREMVSTIEVSPEARIIAGELFRPLPGMPGSGAALWLAGELTVWLLPPRLRRQYGLTISPARSATFAAGAAMSRRLLPLIPTPHREPPAALMPESWRRGRDSTAPPPAGMR